MSSSYQGILRPVERSEQEAGDNSLKFSRNGTGNRSESSGHSGKTPDGSGSFLHYRGSLIDDRAMKGSCLVLTRSARF